MATYIVWSGGNGTSGTLAGGWASAYATTAAGLAAATADNDEVWIHYTHTEEFGATDTTLTCGAAIKIITVDKDSSNAQTPMGAGAWLGSSSTNCSVTLLLTSAKPVYVYGLTLRNAGTTADHIRWGGSNNTISINLTLESCYSWLGNTSSTATIQLGTTGVSVTGGLRAHNCTFRCGARQQVIVSGIDTELVGCTLSTSGTKQDEIFETLALGTITAIGCDLSWAGNSGGNNIARFSGTGNMRVTLINCQLVASWTPFTINAEPANGSLTMYGCSDGDYHYEFCLANGYGTLKAYTSIYANDAPTYDGTNKFSWRIDTTSHCSPLAPFVTPWLSTYAATGTSKTLTIEGLISSTSDTDASTQLEADEVWGEFLAQDTAGYPLAVHTNDRVWAAGTSQSSSKTNADWAGEETYYSTFKASVSGVNLDEIGEVRGRICVAFDTSTRGSLYIDPQVRVT